MRASFALLFSLIRREIFGAEPDKGISVGLLPAGSKVAIPAYVTLKGGMEEHMNKRVLVDPGRGNPLLNALHA